MAYGRSVRQSSEKVFQYISLTPKNLFEQPLLVKPSHNKT